MKLLFSMLLLFMGVSMQAQSVAAKQMDERFNDGTKMPYGWFAEGWKVSDGKAKAEATDGSSGFDFSQMMNMNPEDMKGDGAPNMMGSMFGGPRYRTYLLTPPVVVKAGEELVFSASKPSGDDGGFSFDLKAMMGMSDTIFVVERSVYGKNQWVRVVD